MAGNTPPEGGLGDDFLEQILAAAPPQYGGEGGSMPMILQLGPTGATNNMGFRGNTNNMGMSMGMGNMGLPPLGLNLEQTFLTNHNHDNNPSSAIHERDSVHQIFPTFGHLQNHPLRPSPPHLHQSYHVQSTPAPQLQPPSIRPRVRARRGQATDPHSIAERLRRERIAERMKALQELVPSCNKTDRAAMLDEIVDYVKFLRLQVKVLSMSRLGGAGAVAQLVADVPLSSVEGEGIEGETGQAAWDKWSTDGTEQQVAKLMEEDVGAAMQFLQTKALCIMPISLASAIFRTHQPDGPAMIKPESNNSS